MVHAVVLAAGLGTRMKSPLAKVLHPVLGRPLVGWVVEALRAAGCQPLLVLHHQADAVRAAFPGLPTVLQAEPRGTGDAVRCALSALPPEGRVVVAAGDTPLVRPESVRGLLAAGGAPVTVAAFEAEDPTGYGRLVAGKGIVEEGECTAEERAIRRVNSGLYVFDLAWLRANVARLQPHAPKGELYLTDLVGPGAAVVDGFAEAEFLGVNDRAQLALARGILRRRRNADLARAGADLADLDSIAIDVTARVGPAASIGAGTTITGSSRIDGSVGPACHLHDTVVEAGAQVYAGTVTDGAHLEAGAHAGPLARLRPGTVLEAGAHVGNFVEVKNTRVGAGAKAGHLSYLGDADIGAEANIGAGTITCNFNGVAKNRTRIGARAFVGSNAALVAPVEVGEGAVVGAGSTITADVPPGAVAVARAPTKVNERAADRLRARFRALDGRKA